MPETKVIVNKRLNLSDYFQLYLKICTENDFFSLPLQHKNKDYGEMPFGDITKGFTKSYMPKDFDVLCGGFPYQAFSLAGRRLGFNDETRGSLFFEIEDILRKHQPKALPFMTKEES